MDPCAFSALLALSFGVDSAGRSLSESVVGDDRPLLSDVGDMGDNGEGLLDISVPCHWRAGGFIGSGEQMVGVAYASLGVDGHSMGSSIPRSNDISQRGEDLCIVVGV